MVRTIEAKTELTTHEIEFLSRADKPRQWFEFKRGEDTPFILAIKILAKQYPQFLISLEERKKDSGEEYQVAYGTEVGKHAFQTVCRDDVFIAAFALWEVGSRLQSRGESIGSSDLWKRSLTNLRKTYRKISGRDHSPINFSEFTKKMQLKPEEAFSRMIKGIIKRKKGMFITGIPPKQ